MSANVARANEGEHLPPRVAAALAAAEIPSSKLGPAGRPRPPQRSGASALLVDPAPLRKRGAPRRHAGRDVISMDEAAAAGQAIFGGVLTQS